MKTTLLCFIRLRNTVDSCEQMPMHQYCSLELQESPQRSWTLTQPLLLPSSSYTTAADVEFMQGMIVHHYQAFFNVRNGNLTRTNNQTILDLAGRIDVSQTDEINFMNKLAG